MTSRDGNFWTSGALPLIPADAFGAMIAAASDVSIVISDVGRILGVTTGATMKDAGDLSRWEGRDIRDVLTVESVPKLEAELERVTGGEGSGTRLVELNHEDEGPWDFPVRYSFHPIGSDGAILMFGRDLRPVADMQQQLVRAQMALEREYEAQREYDTRMRVLMEATAEAVVFVSLGSGRVLECNSAAAALLGAEPGELVGKPLADLFEDGAEVMRGLGRAGETDAGPASVLTRGPRGRRIGLAPTLFRAAGERMALCRLTSTDRASAPSDSLSDTLTAFFRAGSDAIVVTDARGAVESAKLLMSDAGPGSRSSCSLRFVTFPTTRPWATGSRVSRTI